MGAERPTAVLVRRHPVFGVDATPLPSILWILLGIALGPMGLGLLSPAALRHLDLVVTLCLALLGVLVGLGLARHPPRDPLRTAIAATVEAALSIAAVAGVLAWLLATWDLPLPMPRPSFVVLVAICAAASAAMTDRDGDDALRGAAQLANVGDLPLVLAGTIALAMLGREAILSRLLMTAAAAIGVGFAGSLLFERASPAERGVFLGGAILLLGGIGRYLATSGLLAGFVAAMFWVRMPGVADRIASDDLRRFQHPLVMLLLVIGGATLVPTVPVIWVAAALVLLRLTAKLLAGAAVARLIRAPVARVASLLVPPGTLGIAIALNARQILDGAGTVLVGVIVLTVVASELAALALAHEREPAS